MTRIAINYSNTVMYKIVCKDLNITDCYVGHTTMFSKRKYQHKMICNNPNGKFYNFKVYETIRQNGGWDNWEIIEIEKYPCNDNNEARARERYWFETLNSNLNCNNPFITNDEKQHYMKNYMKNYREQNKDELIANGKEYYKNNKDYYKEIHKQYYDDNKESLRERQKQYKEENKEKIREQRKIEYQKNKNEIKHKNKRYYEANKELIKEQHKQYKEQKNKIKNVLNLLDKSNKSVV